MDWKISSKEEYKKLSQKLCLPKPLQKTSIAFILQEESGDFALSESPVEASFPTALLKWKELKETSTWEKILQLHPVEKSAMAHYWYSILREREVDAKIFLQNYGLSLHFQNLADWEELGQLRASSRALARSYSFPLRILRLWNRIPEKEQKEWLKIWEGYNFGRNLIQDIICDYYELDEPKREEALGEAMALGEKFSLTKSRAKTRQEKDKRRGSSTKLLAREARLIRDKVRELRMPELTKMRTELHKERRKLSQHLKPSMELELPGNLESSSLELKLRFSSIEEIQKSLVSLQKKETLRAIQKILEIACQDEKEN